MTGRVVAWLVCIPVFPAAALGAQGTLADRPARFSVTDLPVDRALNELSRRSGVTIAFSPDLTPDVRVSCDCVAVTVGQALDSILEPHGLAFRVTRTQILIVRAVTRQVRGRVVLETDGSPVPRALVRSTGGGSAVARDDGTFELVTTLEPARVVVTRLGIRADSTPLPAGVREITLRVEPREIELEPVEAREAMDARRTEIMRFETRAQTSTVTISGRTLASVPGIAEADVVRAVQTLPGVVAKNDFSIGYNVRGGETDQNLILLDGITVLNPSHLGGLFSTFDANALGETNFLTGGFPAEYSGRLSSVLDMRVRDDATRFGGAGQVSLLASKLMFEGPVGERGSYVISGRRTYVDKVVSTFSRHEIPYYFTDFVGKLRVPLAGGALAVTGHWGRDVLDFEITETTVQDTIPVDFRFNWGNRLAGARWTRPLGAGVAEVHASVSEFTSEFGLFPDLVRLANDVRIVTGGIRYHLDGSGDDRLIVGAEVETARASYSVDQPQFEFEPEDLEAVGFLPVFNRRYRPTTYSVFADQQWTFGHRLMVRPGVRVQHTTGRDFTGVAPRLSTKFFLNPQRAIVASAGRYYQVLHSLRDQDLPITVFEFWVGANERIPVAKSDHLVLGVEQWIDRDVQIRVEGYRKTYDDLVIPNRAIALRDAGDEFLPMDGDSWGVDVLLRRHTGGVRGWIAYGFNRSIRRADGREFPPSQDRRHTLNVLLEMPGPLGADLGVRWAYGSALPYTDFVGEWAHRRFSPVHNGFVHSRTEPISIGINDARFPAYNRLDLALRWRRETASGLRFEPYLQVANAYNRRNVFFYSFEYGNRPPTRTTVTQLPIFPTFGVEFSW